jgi:hypothetical protein
MDKNPVKERRNPAKTPQESAANMIRITLIIIGCAILGAFGFETVLGIQPSYVETIAICLLVIIAIWLKEKA